MRKIGFLAILLIPIFSLAQSYPPAAGVEGSTAISFDDGLFVAWATGAEIERGLIDISNPSLTDHGSNYASYGVATDALGVADNQVVSLGDAGVAILTFENPITNGPGFDFAVFENGLSDMFLELAFVEVSSDGENFFRFPAHSETQTETQTGGFGNTDPTYLNNLAGKYRVFFGTPFDLDDLEDHVLLDKSKITHVKIIDVVGSINPEYGSFDFYGNIVNDPFPTPFWSSGFDLDAVGVIHEVNLATTELDFTALKIYPNPAKNEFFVGLKNRVEVQVFDESAKMVLKVDITDNQAIDISNLKQGVYFVYIKLENKNTFHKLIKK